MSGRLPTCLTNHGSTAGRTVLKRTMSDPLPIVRYTMQASEETYGSRERVRAVRLEVELNHAPARSACIGAVVPRWEAVKGQLRVLPSGAVRELEPPAPGRATAWCCSPSWASRGTRESRVARAITSCRHRCSA